MIKRFKGQYAFLSNFHYSPFTIDGYAYRTVEHYYQASKARGITDHIRVMASPTPGEAKKRGRRVELRNDWEETKEDIMLNALRKKFAIPWLRKGLLATGTEELIEGNTWGDTYWGVDLRTSKGKNRLGYLLMRLRKEIRKEQ